VKYVVVVADRIADSGFALLRACADLEIVSTVGAPDRLRAELARAHALIVRSETRVSEELIADAPELSLIARAGTGVDNIDVSAATRRGLAVLNAPGANTVSAAEHTMALLLATMRRIPWAAASMRSGQWDRRSFAGTELRGKTLGVVGLGRIGAQVASLARAFGMKVIAHDPYLPETRAKELGVELLSIEALLPVADIVSLHLPLTADTKRLMNRERLALMKSTAVLVNTARGGLIDHAALLEALNRGALGGAALDVFDPEPLPADSPLRSCERVLLTPHLAASTPEAQERVAQEICAAVRDALLTGAVVGAVNLPGIDGAVLRRLAGVLELSRRLGRLATCIAPGRVRGVEVSYGGDDEQAPRPVMLAAVDGVLDAMGVNHVTLVNALVLAEERGLTVERRVGAAIKGFATTVGVTLSVGDGRTCVMGALVGDRAGRVISIDGFPVDVPADGHLIVLRNRDVPGVIGRVGTMLGAAAINIASYHQSRGDRSSGDALAAIVVDQPPDAELLGRLAALPDVLDVRFASVDGP
jgi:D-3-phosphoglycerate dehydrogenase